MHDFYTTLLSQVKSDRSDTFETMLYDRLVEYHKLVPFEIVVVRLFIYTCTTLKTKLVSLHSALFGS